MYSAAAICRSTHLPIPQEGRIITSDDVFGHLPDIRCINGGIDFSVNGKPVNLADTVTYRGMMFTGVPNMLWVMGYLAKP